MIDRNDIDIALFQMRQMARVAIGAQESLMGSETDPDIFEMPALEANLLSFACFDLLARVEALEAAMCGCAPQQAA
jgi:hypothetical protein